MKRVTLLVALLIGCRSEAVTSSSSTSAPWSTPTTVAAPKATSAAPVTSAEPAAKMTFEVVADLNKWSGHWGANDDSGQWAEFVSKEEGVKSGLKWGLSFPWRIFVKLKGIETPFTCGFFERLQDDWRVAYCFGGNIPDKDKMKADRLILYLKDGNPKQLRVKIGSREEVVFDRFDH